MGKLGIVVELLSLPFSKRDRIGLSACEVGGNLPTSQYEE